MEIFRKFGSRLPTQLAFLLSPPLQGKLGAMHEPSARRLERNRRRAPGPCLTPDSLGSGGGSRGASWFGGRELNFYLAGRCDLFFSIASTCKGISVCWKRGQTLVVKAPSTSMELIQIHSGVCMVGVCHCIRWHARAERMCDHARLHAGSLKLTLAQGWRLRGAFCHDC